MFYFQGHHELRTEVSMSEKGKPWHCNASISMGRLYNGLNPRRIQKQTSKETILRIYSWILFLFSEAIFNFYLILSVN